MTDIPGTAMPAKSVPEAKKPDSYQLNTILNVQNIKRSKVKPTALTFENSEFKKWVIYCSIATALIDIILLFFSYKFILLVFSGPGIGVLSFAAKEWAKKHLSDNDQLIRRY